MDSLGYWVVLMILYILSAMMKKRQQKSARRELDQGEEKGWQTPDFVKELFADYVDDGEKELDGGVVSELEEGLEVELYESSLQESPIEIVEETPLEKRHLSNRLEKHEVGTIAHRKQKREISRSRYFKHQGDVRLAMIYKEIMDKPRALRHNIR